jgi:hypothetical protein
MLMTEDRDWGLLPVGGVRLSFRIEFWENPDGPSLGKLAGAALCSDAYLAAVLPRPGDLVSTGILTGYELPFDSSLALGPFMEVFSVEHYPALLDDSVRGAAPTRGGPGVQVVFRVKPPHDRQARDAVEKACKARGWRVDWETDSGLGE